MPQDRTRLPNLDALRILAALGVCWFHFNRGDGSGMSRLWGLGYLGVNVFFCISGYITPLVLDWSGFGYRDSGRFLVSRFFRLYPAFAVIALMEILLRVFGSSWFGYGQHVGEITWSRTLANFLWYADFAGERWYGSVFWTLGVEGQFVLAMLLCFPLLAHPRVMVGAGVVMLWALAPLTVAWGPSILSYGALFAMGMAVFLKRHRSLPWWAFAFLVGAAFCVHAAAVHPPAAWTALGTALAVGFVPQMPAGWAERLRIGYLGRLAYPFFLIHIPFGGAVIFHLRWLPQTWPCQALVVVLATLAAGVAAAVFHRWIESPCHRYARRLKGGRASGGE